MPYFTYCNGKQIFYRETGNSEGEPCIFLHGNTASSRMFEFILPLYQEEMKAVLTVVPCRKASERKSSGRGQPQKKMNRHGDFMNGAREKTGKP